jgi:hypothetical protein
MRRLVVSLSVLALLLASALAVPVSAGAQPARAAAAAGACNDDAYPPSPHATIMSSTTTPAVGETIEASGTYYCPNEDVQLTLDGADVGTAHTDAQGAFDPPVVVTKAGSALQLCGIGASGLADDRDCITLNTRAAVAAGDGTGSGSGSGNAGGGTALTGLDVAGLVALGVVLLVGGAVLVATSRRKRLSGVQS